jgi:signal transduction histidine kinase/DNA-binding response OmpR family regulator
VPEKSQVGTDGKERAAAPYISLRSKLLRTMMGTWVLVTLVTLGAVGAGQYRASNDAAHRTETRVRDNQREKGRLLVANQALAIRVMAMDNAFSDVREIVGQTVLEDVDVIYGTYIDAASAPWIVVTPKTPDAGLSGAGATAALGEIPPQPSYAPARGPRVRTVLAFGANVEEFAADVFDGEDYLGTVRYGISMVRTEQAVAQEIEHAKRSLVQLLGLLALLGAAGVIMGVAAIRRISHRITQPLSELAAVSAELARGNRGVRVTISSGDEIEQLARTFNGMAEANENAMLALEVKTTEALESSRMKSEFLANMSHEIRTPMNGILGVARLVHNMPLEGKLRRYIELIDSSASALLTIINDVLDFSKMEAGKYRLKRVVFDLRTLVQEVCELLANRAHDKGLELICRIDPKMGPLHHGDPDRLRQVISNLLGNAIKFTERGEVFVDVRVVESDAQSELIRVAVMDTGIGIAPNDMAKLFEAFSQVDGSMMRKAGGTGLGLAISKRLVEMMGGSVEVKSTPGEGSEFSCQVRLDTGGEGVEDRGVWADGKRAIVVESHPRWEGVVREHLEAWGMTVLSFERGEDALAHIEGNAGIRVDVAVIGTQPDKGASDEFVRRLRSIEGAARTPIVALYQLSTGSFVSDIEKELAAQIPKPLRFSELYNAMQRILLGTSLPNAPLPSAGHVPMGRVGRVLVVDDNEINRFVAAEMLQEMGYEVETAENGAEAVERVRHGQFGVVLMDCQMPVMDGYTATREIRRSEEGSARHQAIVALTAHALAGERERVLAAGMDDYLSKPVRPTSLDKMIRRYAKCKTAGAAKVPASATVADEDPELDGKFRRSAKLIELFLKNVPRQLDAIETAATEGQATDLRAHAHKTKGSCLALGAISMAKTAEKLQHLAETGNLGGSVELVAVIRDQYGRVALELGRERTPI